MIATEAQVPVAPVIYHLRVHDKVRPGTYSLPLYLTYNDGYTWNTASFAAEIIVPNWFQRHQLLVWVLGTVIAFVLGCMQVLAALPVFNQWTDPQSMVSSAPLSPTSSKPGSPSPTPSKSGSPSPNPIEVRLTFTNSLEELDDWKPLINTRI
jgi:hypothetical protein